ncbi:zinc ABC transporter ATP-binding protein [Paenibacillus rhizosphaerae]|uniref:Zinc ABC transporter ATP-binding protein n=1 Tax=Paenibacillus rhizosphaerae TaxID=297318 RepID=A0A1R1EC58_9BACL|nr:metal ABC transporter ATP-binding protein [Paenibacillus rhizosphaerae]OMF49413.1 zinc ABC transporter ATP-binding protein [Paenibacillus rhizosphaerae]
MMVSSMRDVVFGYGNEPVIENLSLDIHAGQFIGIAGANGAAKSTLLKLMMGLIKPWSGSVWLNRANKDGSKVEVGYVPQQVSSFNAGFPSKVIELVRSGMYSRMGLFGRFRKEHQQVVERSLKQVGMWEFRDRRIGELSGGQKQRVCIARALAQEPQVLVLDEPMTGMDKASRIKLYELLRDSVTRHGQTVIMVTHELDEAMPYLDTLVKLERKEDESWHCSVSNLCSVPFGREA